MPIGIRLSIVIEIPDSENDSMGNLRAKINENVKEYLGKDFVKIGGAEIETIHGGGGSGLLEDDYHSITNEITEAEEKVNSLQCKLDNSDRAMMEYNWEEE